MQAKRTQKERRAESDARIISSAIKCFGRKGYTHTAIKDVAKDAGVTGPLISQRYESKEKLFLAAYEEATRIAFTEVEAGTSPRECLTSIIHDIETLSNKDPEAFTFCSMLFSATDYPREILVSQYERCRKTVAYEILKNAHAKGILPKGNLDVHLFSTCAMVFRAVELCQRSGLDFPEPERYFSLIGFNDKRTLQEAKWHYIIETAISNTFDRLIYINIAENKAEIIQKLDTLSNYGDYSDAKEVIERNIQSMIPKEQQEEAREHLNLDTLSDRMRGKKSVSFKSKQNDGSILVHSFLPLSWDEKGNLVEVFSGVYQVGPDGLPE